MKNQTYLAFFNRLALGSKPGNKWRHILDLNPLNNFLKSEIYYGSTLIPQNKAVRIHQYLYDWLVRATSQAWGPAYYVPFFGKSWPDASGNRWPAKSDTFQAECGSRQAIQTRPDHPNRVVSFPPVAILKIQQNLHCFTWRIWPRRDSELFHLGPVFSVQQIHN